MDVSEAKRLKVLEDENAKLKKLLAEQMLDVAAMWELLSKNGRARRVARRRRASVGRDGPVGTSRACLIVGADRKMVRYGSRRPPDTELGARLRELANERWRFGYRRLFILLRREGESSGVNRIHRLYREEGLSVRKRRARRKAVGARALILVEAKPNARWSTDFVHDQFVNGRRFRILNIVDDVTKQCLGPITDTSISTMPAPRSRPGFSTSTPRADIRRSDTSRRRPMPPISPQGMIGCATQTSSAERPLLHPRYRA